MRWQDKNHKHNRSGRKEEAHVGKQAKLLEIVLYVFMLPILQIRKPSHHAFRSQINDVLAYGRTGSQNWSLIPLVILTPRKMAILYGPFRIYTEKYKKTHIWWITVKLKQPKTNENSKAWQKEEITKINRNYIDDKPLNSTTRWQKMA